MSRLIDADEAYEVITEAYHHTTDTQHMALREALDRIPTVDAVEVVRCKECIYASYSKAYRRLVCDVDDGELVDEDFFCSCGRRKEEK